MRLDRNINADGHGKYALVFSEELAGELLRRVNVGEAA